MVATTTTTNKNNRMTEFQFQQQQQQQPCPTCTSYRKRRRNNINNNPLFPILLTTRFIQKDIYSIKTTILLLLLLLFFSTIFPFVTIVDSYPSYLLSKSTCYTQLSTDEVIMNHGVLSAEQSEDHDMHIRAFAASDGTELSKLPHHISPTTVVVPSGFPAVISIHLVTTNTNTDQTYQWAIDVIDPDDSDKPPAHFVDGGCPNKVRITGRSDEVVSVTIERDGAQLIAGWAIGMEAVRLSPILTFIHVPAANEVDDPQKIVDAKVLKAQGSDGSTGLLSEQVNRHRDKLLQMENLKNPKDNNNQDEKQKQSTNGDKNTLDEGEEKEKKKKTLDDSFLHRLTIDEQEERVKEFLLQDKHSDVKDQELYKKKYYNENEQQQQQNNSKTKFGITSTSYFQGCFVLIFVSYITIQFCIWLSTRTTGTKGRRDL